MYIRLSLARRYSLLASESRIYRFWFFCCLLCNNLEMWKLLVMLVIKTRDLFFKGIWQSPNINIYLTFTLELTLNCCRLLEAKRFSRNPGQFKWFTREIRCHVRWKKVQLFKIFSTNPCIFYIATFRTKTSVHLQEVR